MAAGNGNGSDWNARAFDEFWAHYPKKVGKKAARKEWDKAHVTPELFEQIQKTLDWEIEQWDDPQFIPHPRTWLSQGRWDDEPVAVAQKPKPNGCMRTAGNVAALQAFVKRGRHHE